MEAFRRTAALLLLFVLRTYRSSYVTAGSTEHEAPHAKRPSAFTVQILAGGRFVISSHSGHRTSATSAESNGAARFAASACDFWHSDEEHCRDDRA